MRSSRSGAMFLLALACFLLVSAPSPSFAENHVVLKDFHWQVRSTEHFDINYYEGSATLVPLTAEILERSYRKISEELDTGFTRRRPLFLYANPNDFEQSNIAQVGDGTGGITEPFKDRFMVYNDGTQQWLDDVLTHELTHVFQYSVLISGFWKSVRILKTIVYPLWMMEGMAEYSTGGLDDTNGEMYVRDAATSGGLIPLYKLEHFSALKPHQVTLGYKSGAAALGFLGSQYGKDKVGKMLKLFESRFESSSVLQELIGIDLMTFDKKWREYEEEKYRRVVRENRLRDPWEFGVSLTTSSGFLPEFNTTPVLTPDGRSMAYLSTRDGQSDVEVLMQNLADHQIKRAVGFQYMHIENIPTANFDNIARVLAISPDGQTLAFGAQKNHVQSLYFFNIKTRKLHKVLLPGLMTAQQPTFSPDGSKVAFSGMKDGLTDLYLLDLKTEKYTALTSDPQDDQSPSFSPDGESIVYSSEISIPNDPMPHQRRLYRLSLKDHSLQKLEDIPGAARDPVYSAGGDRVLFTLEGGGFADIYELNLKSGHTLRLTRTVGNSFTPIYSPSGDVVFSAFRKGCVHIYRGDWSKLLSEDVPTFPNGKRSGGTAGLAADSTGGGKVIESLPGMSSASPTEEYVSTSTEAFLSPARPFHDTVGTDLFLPAAFYSSIGGFFWASYWQGSDMLGNHQGAAQLAYNSGSGYLNYQTQYVYSRYRPELGLSVFGVQQANSVDLASGLATNETNHTELAQVLYPLDRYHSLRFQAGVVTDQIDYPDIPGTFSRQDARIYSTSFIRDTVGGKYLEEIRGSRLLMSYYQAVPVLGGHVQDHTFSGEGQKFFPTGDLSTLALRVVGADSIGPDAQGFILGGLGGVRGYGRSTYDNVGTRMGLLTAEYRFPLLKNLDYYMWYIFPDFYFKAITAAVFSDTGYTWNAANQLTASRWNSLRNSYGVGIRIHTFILQLYQLVIQMDYARRTTSPGGIFYVYLGPLF